MLERRQGERRLMSLINHNESPVCLAMPELAQMAGHISVLEEHRKEDHLLLKDIHEVIYKNGLLDSVKRNTQYRVHHEQEEFETRLETKKVAIGKIFDVGTKIVIWAIAAAFVLSRM